MFKQILEKTRCSAQKPCFEDKLLPPNEDVPFSSQCSTRDIQQTDQSMESSTKPSNVSLLCVGFNQDYGCFACGTETGFRIYNSDPLRETFRREFDGGIGFVQMLFRCNVLALVGGGKAPRYSPNKVMIWDDHQNKCIGELSFRNDVRAVQLRRDRIVVILEYKIYIYNFADLKLLHQIETLSNTIGLCVLSSTSNSIVLACPGQRKGEVRIEIYHLKRTRFIQAHESFIACLALSTNGSILATASRKGTLIRIFHTYEGTPLQEVNPESNKLSRFRTTLLLHLLPKLWR